jgi:Fe-S-cluster containining protein
MDKNNGASGDMLFIQENWVMIPEETAQRLNPYLLTAREATGPTAYFTCLRRSKEGCSIHKDRPEVCSGYPNYDTPLDRYLEGSPIPEYHSECTLWKEGLIKRLLIAINCK